MILLLCILHKHRIVIADFLCTSLSCCDLDFDIFFSSFLGVISRFLSSKLNDGTLGLMVRILVLTEACLSETVTKCYHNTESVLRCLSTVNYTEQMMQCPI